ncbi:MAG TPA: type II toxin-antitoxin system VapC family toxin [Pseudonocardiaceae bacterium]|jgi:predicted nucleic acid-binding protein|nr:type II toxin-antitoxin system VapC family toxin [Pseudonocardiaceae bacterium]
MTEVIVVDNSALIEIVASIGTTAEQGRDKDLLRRLMLSTGCAPEIIDAEALNVLRRMAMRGHLTDEQATLALSRVADAPIRRFEHRPLLHDAWRLRHAITGSDALYVALAEQLDAPLITCDGRLANSNGHNARIELYSTSS